MYGGSGHKYLGITWTLHSFVVIGWVFRDEHMYGGSGHKYLGLTWTLNSFVVIGIDTDVLVFGVEGEFANVQCSQFVVAL